MYQLYQPTWLKSYFMLKLLFTLVFLYDGTHVFCVVFFRTLIDFEKPLKIISPQNTTQDDSTLLNSEVFAK